MKKLFIITLLCLSPLLSKSQRSFTGFGLDYNGSFKPGNTFGLGFHLDARLGRSKWYVTWNYAAGANYRNDLYYRSSILLKLYVQPEYWEPGPNPTLGGFIGLVLFPAMCPMGIADYFYESPNRRVKMGLYSNIFIDDFWDITNSPIDSWSPEFGYKVFFNFRSGVSLYFSVGSSISNNMKQYEHSSATDGPHLNVCLGLARRGVD